MLFLPSIICVLIALQWAGIVYAWSSPRIIVLMVFFAVLFVAFIINELWMGPKATIPPKIASQRTVAAASCFAFCNYAQFFIFVYFIPIYYTILKASYYVGESMLWEVCSFVPLISLLLS